MMQAVLSTMTARRNPDRSTAPVKIHDGRGRSKNKNRQIEDARHHEGKVTLPHPPHKTLKKPTGLPRHHPHTKPVEHALDIDHGIHEDRPRPGKLAKKSAVTGKSLRKK
jgi:hypothetical protein